MSPVISRCHAKCTSLSLGRNNYFFNSFELSCFSSIQTHSIFSFSTMLHSAANMKPVYPFPICARKNSSEFSSTYLTQIHRVSNDCKQPLPAARCHTMNPALSMNSNNIYLSSFMLSCVSSAQNNIPFSVTTWLFLAAKWKALYSFKIIR